MDIIRHEIVGDRVIHGEGTRLEEWRTCEILQQMPEFDISQIIPPNARVCIIAPHPDDEILGCGGLIQRLDKLGYQIRSEEHTSELQSRENLVCRLLLEKKKIN